MLVVFDAVYILFHFNITLKQNEIPLQKKIIGAVVCSISVTLKGSALQEAEKSRTTANVLSTAWPQSLFRNTLAKTLLMGVALI